MSKDTVSSHSSQASDATTLSDSLSSQDGLIGNLYRKLEDLGVGGYSRVLLAAHKDTKELVAVKILLSEPIEEKNDQGQITNIKWEISKSKYRQCKREMELMKKIQHDNVVKLLNFMDNATFPQKRDKKFIETPCLCVVLEYCSKGELFDYLMYAGGLGSRVTRTYFHQFLNGLQAMHKAGYVHRDLKPENLLLDDNYNLKIADFGFATPFKNNKEKIMLASTCGTRGYLAPELIKGEKYTHMVDLFAVGIIMFTTFAGFPPFQHAGRGDWWWDKMEKAWGYWHAASQLNNEQDKTKKAEKIAKGNQKMKLFWSAHERSCKFSDSFKHLMQYLLNPNPTLRYDIAECFEHPWLKGKTLNARQLKKTMKKHSEKVNRQRAKKIAEQLASRNMEETKSGPTRGIFDKNEQLLKEVESTVSKNDGLTVARNTAILNKARFQILSNKSLKQICSRVEDVALKHSAHVHFDKKSGEFLITAAVTRSRNAKEVFPKSEKIHIKVKIINSKCVDFNDDDNSNEDNKDDEDNFITDSDDDDNDDIESKTDDQKDSTSNKDVVNNSNDNNNDNSNDNNNNSNKGNNNKVDKGKNDDTKRYYVVFWRVEGSADGFQRVMALLFYDIRISDLMDLDVALGDDSNENSNDGKDQSSGLNYKTPAVFADVFKKLEEQKHTHYAASAESDILPDSNPIPTY